MSNIMLQYKKELRRLKRAVRTAEKQGFEVSSHIKKYLENPVKRPTAASINRLRTKFSTDVVNRSSYKVDTETGEIISRRQAIIRDRRERSEAKKAAAQVKKVQPTTQVPQTEQPLDEIQMLLDKMQDNIDYIRNISDENTQFYKDGKTIKNSRDEIVKILESYYITISSVCENKLPLPKVVYDQLKALANDKFFSLDQYGYEEEEVAEPLCAKMLELAKALDDKDLADMASELADKDEWVEISDQFMAENGWMFDYLP